MLNMLLHRLDWEFVAYCFKIRKSSFLRIFIKQVSSLHIVFEIWNAHFVYWQANIGSADIFYS